MATVQKFTKEQVEDIATEAATKALGRLLTSLDVDVSRPEDIRRLRDNLNYLDAKKQGEEHLKDAIKQGAMYGVGVAALGLLYLLKDILYEGFMSVVMGGK